MAHLPTTEAAPNIQTGSPRHKIANLAYSLTTTFSDHAIKKNKAMITQRRASPSPQPTSKDHQVQKHGQQYCHSYGNF